MFRVNTSGEEKVLIRAEFPPEKTDQEGRIDEFTVRFKLMSRKKFRALMQSKVRIDSEDSIQKLSKMTAQELFDLALSSEDAIDDLMQSQFVGFPSDQVISDEDGKPIEDLDMLKEALIGHPVYRQALFVAFQNLILGGYLEKN